MKHWAHDARLHTLTVYTFSFYSPCGKIQTNVWQSQLLTHFVLFRCVFLTCNSSSIIIMTALPLFIFLSGIICLYWDWIMKGTDEVRQVGGVIIQPMCLNRSDFKFKRRDCPISLSPHQWILTAGWSWKRLACVCVCVQDRECFGKTRRCDTAHKHCVYVKSI